jgi:predicted GNAT family acetyltransferase
MGFMIANNLSAERFEAVSGEDVAFLEYEINGPRMTLVHTEVPESLAGKGLGGKLVKFALAYAEQNDLTVVAQCEFAQSYIVRHEAPPDP